MMEQKQYLLNLPLTREEYQLVCRALVKVEAEVRAPDSQDILFWGEDSADKLSVARNKIREAFTDAFGQMRFYEGSK